MTSYLNGYLDDVAFERLLIRKVLPVVPRDAGSASAIYDIQTGRTSVGISLHDSLGMTLNEAVIKLGIIPLAVAASWKTIDVLLEYALDAQSYFPRRGRRWTIEDKVDHGRDGHGEAMPLSADADIWQRILGSYVGLEEVRHSLTHRRATLEGNGDLVGVDRSGVRLRPMTQDEQVSFSLGVTCALDAFERQALSRRERNEMLYHFDQLNAWHGLPTLGAYKRPYPLPRIEVIIEPPTYGLKLSTLKAELLGKFRSAPEVDLIVRFAGHTRVLQVELEAVPPKDLVLDPSSPPLEQWCQVLE